MATGVSVEVGLICFESGSAWIPGIAAVGDLNDGETGMCTLPIPHQALMPGPPGGSHRS